METTYDQGDIMPEALEIDQGKTKVTNAWFILS